MINSLAKLRSSHLLVCSLVASAACSGGGGDSNSAGNGSGDGDGSGDGGGSDNGGMRDTGSDGVPIPDMSMDYLFPDIAHTGFDGKHVFKVPVSTRYADPKWSVSDPSIADIVAVATPAAYAAYGRTWAMVTTKKAGKTYIMAEVTKENGARATAFAALLVESYKEADVTGGDKRYNNPDNPTAAQRPSCASCHQQAGGHDHSPVVLGWYDDENILTAITTGAYKTGPVLTGVNHTWNLTDAERRQIVPYLRTLPPRAF